MKKKTKNGPIKTFLIELAKKNAQFRVAARFFYDLLRRIRYNMRGIGVQTKDKSVFFIAFKGNAFVCSPKAIYENMLADPKYKDYQFVWAFDEPEKYRFLLDNRNTSLVKTNSRAMEVALHEAQYWIANHRVPDYISPKANQTYVQCWHGTPLKRLGYDLAFIDNAMNSSDEMWSKYKIDAKKFKYLISPSAYATEKFTSAWNLKSIHKESAVIETGYPRNDFLHNYTDLDKDELYKRLGIEAHKSKKIALYAPTWRDNQFQSEIGYTYNHQLNLDLWQKELGEEYIILCRFHYFVANQIDFDKYQGFIYNLSDYDDINHLYVVSDLLITDYSSVFFDYANLQRPILFYMYDLEDYRDNIRGFYIGIDELPGKVITSEDQLLEEVRGLDFQHHYDDKYKKFNEKFNYLDDGHAAERAAVIIFQEA